MADMTLAAFKISLHPPHTQLGCTFVDRATLSSNGPRLAVGGQFLATHHRASRRIRGLGLIQRRKSLCAPRAAVEDSTSTTVQRLSEEDEALQKVADIQRVLELLREKRDMDFNEVRLTVMIEDPREAERRKKLNLEDESGVSRDELAAALVDVNEGRIPEDSLTLTVLHKTMVTWPNLDDATIEEEEELLRVMGRKGASTPSPYSASSGSANRAAEAARIASQAWDDAGDIEEVKGTDVDSPVPPVVGYSVLYLVSGIPILIGVAVVIILFVNSLQ
eukprot:TRINITY_DN3417_c0_g1_i1.p1 TRINITY_DN3417_c0_g1~~TRINITY_DN3417_c0_g1_i1.p1  ORF type:complete len:277 (-),score=60.72 TRINITY_DN3417_c0_g1_i1:109-939(-)